MYAIKFSTAGHYDLKTEDILIKRLSFNYNRIESDVSFVDMDIIADQLGEKCKCHGRKRTKPT